MESDKLKVIENAQALVRSAGSGVLSTHSLDLSGYPFGSITPYASTPEGGIVIHVSAIAQHTHNLDADKKACLTVVQPSGPSGEAAQSSGRVTLVGDAMRVSAADLDAVSERYFSFFPRARKYSEVHDFFFYLLEPVRIRYIAGFGEIHWIERDEWSGGLDVEAVDPARIVSHMNDDHSDSLVTLCALLRDDSSESAKMLSVDPIGFHVQTSDAIHYIRFASRCQTTEEIRNEMIRLVREAAA